MKTATAVWIVWVLACVGAAVALVGCGSVTPIGVAAAGGESSGGAGGAGGELGPDAGGAGGLLEEGGAGGALVDQGGAGGAQGGAGGALVDAGGAGDVGPHVGATTAPACRGTFVGASSECQRVTLPNGHSLQCEVGCSSLAADNAGGCVSNGVTYCVASCSACVP